MLYLSHLASYIVYFYIILFIELLIFATNEKLNIYFCQIKIIKIIIQLKKMYKKYNNIKKIRVRK
jgi:hypothetical protein